MWEPSEAITVEHNTYNTPRIPSLSQTMPIEPSYGEREMDVASAKCPPTTDKSTDFHRQRFAREAYRLFTSDTSCVESLRVLTDSVDLERWVALQGESIEDLVEVNRSPLFKPFSTKV